MPGSFVTAQVVGAIAISLLIPWTTLQVEMID